MIGLVTDSNSQLPPKLVRRYGVEVVPLTVVIDGVEHAEGIDIDADAFFARFEGGAAPDVATAAPAPGLFAAAYQRLAERGCREILSVHIGSEISGTLNSARVAAEAAALPVRLVDTGTASFGISCCLWRAAEAIAGGATLEDAAHLAERTAAATGNVFVVQALDLARRGGRLSVDVTDTHDVPILSLVFGEVRAVGAAATVDDAAEAMAAFARSDIGGREVRVAVGLADLAGRAVAEALAERLAAEPGVVEIVRYRIGPSVAVHTGPGSAGAFWFPA